MLKSRKVWATAACFLMLAVGLCCQRRNSTGDATVILIETEKQPAPVVVTPPPPPPAPDPDMPSWLFPSRFQEGAKDGWVKGEFDRKKNKLIIRTNQVQQFAVNTSEVPIDWDKLVVLSIDGKNSELRKRDFTVYRFELDSRGMWEVVEPK